ncbi:uncharacterized protein BJX67DRAFT_385496 [Aspergillus lucknowensis]|uniref:Zn(2)-C6 fungal-type domain-containing protein n=1 Tax=Aspergillus lucknowensis TaxID=176173 RepID=A0ABR4LDH7_9EURO
MKASFHRDESAVDLGGGKRKTTSAEESPDIQQFHMALTPNRATDADPSAGTAHKRRKIRKGTTSCWECKRRKVRCSLVDNSSAVCAACQRRGTKCLTQDLPDEAGRTIQAVGDRIGRVEALVDRLVQRTPTPAPNAHTNTASTNHSVCQPTPTNSTLTRNLVPPSARHVVVSGQSAEELARRTSNHIIQGGSVVPPDQHQNPFANVSQELHDSLPSREDISRLCQAGTHVSIAFHATTTIPYPEWGDNVLDETSRLLDIPTPDLHPVLLVKYIFRVVSALQHLDFKKSAKQIVALSEHPQEMLRRLAKTAIRLVTTREELLNIVEGLECVVMETSYLTSCGNWRAAWAASRRALALAQLMGIHRAGHNPPRSIDPRRKADTSFLWYRIVNTDRFLCLVMGLPQGSMDRTMAAENSLALDTALGRLERVHCVVASHILERNDSGPVLDQIDTVRRIENELNRAAEMMPGGWWVAPNLAAAALHADNTETADKPPTVVWDMLRLIAQLYHYGLINQLHIPLMLGFTNTAQLQTYSQTSCVNASREVLSRYVAFRDFNQVAFSCRIADFFALTASLLLLVGHIRQHACSPDGFNSMAHQRQGDRAIIEQALAHLQEIGWVTQDPLTARAADILTRLLGIEAEAARGHTYSTQSVHGADAAPQGAEAALPSGASVLRICVPYFGVVQIVSEGVGESITASLPEADRRKGALSGNNGVGPQNGQAPSMGASELATGAMQGLQGTQIPQDNPVSEMQNGPEAPTPWYAYSGSAVGTDEWTFQGLDLAFFDNFMREPSMLAAENAPAS